MDAEQYAAARAEETFYLRQQLAEAARGKPEFLRMQMTQLALRSNLSRTGGQFLLLPHEECLEIVFGAAGSRKFWEILFNQSMKLPHFLRIMALMGSGNGQQEQMRGLALRSALRDAFDMGEKWLVHGDSLEDERLRIIPRPAAEWLRRNPLRCHLLPPTLVAFLEDRRARENLESSKPRGQRRGGMNYATQDQPLIKKMRHMLTADPPAAGSVWDATDRVVDQALGGGTRDAKRKRLLRRYSEVFSPEHDGKD